MNLRIQAAVTVVTSLISVLTMLPLPSAEAGIGVYSNTTFGQTDNNDPGSLVRPVNVTTTAPVTDINIMINWHAIDGSDCAAPGADVSFADQVAFWLVSPEGTTVHLVYNDLTGTPTYAQGVAPRVEVIFDDEAALAVGGGVPVTGSFRPEESLSAFDGENPNGVWELHFQDSTEFDWLCFYYMSLIVDDTPVVPTDTPIPTLLAASAFCVDENLAVTISAGEGPFDITASAGINTPVNGVGIGTTTINGPEKWDNLTVIETSGDGESINLGQFRCRSDERPVPVSPAHRSRTTNPFPTFSWTGITGANNYRVFVFDDANPAARTVDIRQNSGGPTMMVLSTPLPDGRLFWRVRGRQNRIWSLWSNRFTLFKDPAAP